MREMKDSGIDIVGEIPKGWKLERLRYLCDITTGNQDTQDADPDGEYDFYVRSPKIEKSTKYSFDGEGILMAGDGAGAGRIFHHAYGKYAVHQRVYIINNIREIDSSFLFYYISNVFPKLMDKGSAQSTVPSVRLPMLLNFTLALPDKKKQNLISSYLDTQCSEIDATAEDIQKEISLLEDYKKSVITEAVTKGLNPDAEMKDSGIEWIGEIPKDWVTIRIGNVFSLRNERNYLPMEQVQLLSLYSGKGVFPTGEEGTTNSGNHAQTVADYKIVKKNDIVVNIILAWMGSLGISTYNGVVSPAYDVYIPNEEKVVPHYYHYVFRTSGIANECYRYGRGIMMMRWRTYSSEFKRIHVPFPPLEEQQQIADYLDSKCSEIDTLIADKKRQLDILADYKKSLIYEYVTGKKEVLVKDF